MNTQILKDIDRVLDDCQHCGEWLQVLTCNNDPQEEGDFYDGDKVICPRCGPVGVVYVGASEFPYISWTNAKADRIADSLIETCEDCNGTGFYGDNGPGIIGNDEFVRCESCKSDKCSIGVHRYDWHDRIAWCPKCQLEADMDIARVHRMPLSINAEFAGPRHEVRPEDSL